MLQDNAGVVRAEKQPAFWMRIQPPLSRLACRLLSMSSASKLTAVTIPALKSPATSTIIFVHGLGDSGHGWAPVARQLQPHFPNSRFVLPNAPHQKVTCNYGMVMPSWYDIYSLEEDLGQDEQGLYQSKQRLLDLIQHESETQHIPTENIILGGFSQGAVMSALTGLTSSIKLGGLFFLSGYIPLHEKLPSTFTDANKQTPIFIAHGEQDELIKAKFGEMSKDLLLSRGYMVEWHLYKGMGHEASMEEIMHLQKWLENIIPQ